MGKRYICYDCGEGHIFSKKPSFCPNCGSSNKCMQRQKPKKVKHIESFENHGIIRYKGYCPSCEEDPMMVLDGFNFCPVCGQRLDWGETTNE